MRYGAIGSRASARAKRGIAYGGESFRVFFNDREKVGVLESESGKSYLILDSGDYWFDAIQNGYPKPRKCSCKNDRFFVSFTYVPREFYEDFKEVKIEAKCVNCGKVKKFAISLRQGGAIELLKNPISYCENPKIFYEFTNFLVKSDSEKFERLSGYLTKDLGLIVYADFYDSALKKTRFEKIDFEKLQPLINDKTVWAIRVWFSLGEFDWKKYVEGEDEKGIFIELDAIWRREEAIEFCIASSHTRKLENDTWINISWDQISFAKQQIKNYKVADKSKQFIEICEKMEKFAKEIGYM